MNAGLLFPDHRVSPAQALDLPVSVDAEGWEVYRTFRVGDIVVSGTGQLYRVQGFTRDNTVLVTQHGLGADPAITGLEFLAAGLDHPKAQNVMIHRDGLIQFEGTA